MRALFLPLYTLSIKSAKVYILHKMEEPVMKRLSKLTALLLALALTLSLAACSGGGGGQAATPAPNTATPDPSGSAPGGS